MAKDIMAAQLERMLNGSGRAITPEALEDGGLIQGASHVNPNEWIVLVGLTPYKVVFNQSTSTYIVTNN